MEILGREIDLDALGADDQERLVRLVNDARARQSEALARAIDDGLKHIPKILRKPVRKALF